MTITITADDGSKWELRGGLAENGYKLYKSDKPTEKNFGTPPTDDLDEILSWYYLGDEDRYTPESWLSHKNQAKTRLLKWREEAVVAGRIDELERAIEWFENESGNLFYLDEQLAELKKQRSK